MLFFKVFFNFEKLTCCVFKLSLAYNAHTHTHTFKQSALVWIPSNKLSCKFKLYVSFLGVPVLQCKMYTPTLVHSGFSFDLSLLNKPGGNYKVHSGDYDFYLNVCGGLSDRCDNKSGACQEDKRQV